MSLRLDDKTFSTYQARAALIGCALMRIDDDRGREVFIISREALCKELDSPQSVEAWLKRAGGPSA